MIKGLSAKELEIISHLEFDQKYFFTRSDIRKFFKNTGLMNYYIHRLMKKGRILKLNKRKYYLIPIRAKGGHWAEHPALIADEIMNGKDYFIGGAYAAYIWGMIEQIPRQLDVYTTKKQGRMNIFNVAIIFHRTTQKNLRNGVKRKISGHAYILARKKKAEECFGTKGSSHLE